jgi:peptidoglycan/LPS O-acetylase OafA/YrhL
MKTSRTRTRRGAAVAVLVLLLAAVQMVVVSGVEGSADDAEQAVLRLLSTRTQYAADGAGLIVARQVRAGQHVPSVGTVLTIGSATAKVVAAPAPGTAGDVVVDVRSDRATRRVRISLTD